MRAKSFSKTRTRRLAATLAAATLFFWCGQAHAATLQVSSDTSTLSPGDTATLYVLVNSEGEAINNASGAVTFPADLLEVVSVSKGGSIFSLWVEEPSFSNGSGVVSFDGGVPTPGFNGSRGTILSLVVRAKAAGEATLSFSGAAVRANDGLGTDVLDSQKGKTLTIVGYQEPEPEVVAPVAPAPVEDTVAPSAAGSSGPSLRVSSPTHPNEDRWYEDASPTFRWAVPANAVAVQTGIGTDASAAPRVEYSPAIAEKKVDDLEDGTWYFKARARTGDAWGPTDTYIVRIDATAPENGGVDFTYDGAFRILEIAADIQDVTSGIDRYEVYVGDAPVKVVPAADFVDGRYSLVFDGSGDIAVRLVAIDRAGNSVEASGTFRAAGSSAPTLEPLPSVVPAGERIVVRGAVGEPNAAATVNVSRGGSVTSIEVTSDERGEFFALTPELAPGAYEIWAEARVGESRLSSARARVEATAELLVTAGPFTAKAASLAVPALSALALLLLGAYALGRRSRGRHPIAPAEAEEVREVKPRPKRKAAPVKKSRAKSLAAAKKRLERNLEILQDARHKRLLTEGEKEMKAGIEDDLDRVDRAIEEEGGAR